MTSYTYEELVAEATRRGTWSAALYGAEGAGEERDSFAQWIREDAARQGEFGTWLSRQAVGRPLAPFRGTREEVEWILSHVPCT
jgi:hypothetical protein